MEEITHNFQTHSKYTGFSEFRKFKARTMRFLRESKRSCGEASGDWGTHVGRLVTVKFLSVYSWWLVLGLWGVYMCGV